MPCRWPIEVRAATLHEFAHLYLAPSVYGGNNSYDLPQGHTRVKEFLAAHDLTWHDPDLTWGQQGNERAAETVAWGLMDQRYTVDARLGPLTCAAAHHRLPDPDQHHPRPSRVRGSGGGGVVAMTLTPASRSSNAHRRRGWRGRAVNLVAAGALLTTFGCTESQWPDNPAGRSEQWAAAAEAYLEGLGSQPHRVHQRRSLLDPARARGHA